MRTNKLREIAKCLIFIKNVQKKDLAKQINYGGIIMSEIVDRDTFMYYLNNADVNWEATARECIAKGFEIGDENKKLKEKLETLQDEIGHLQQVLEQIKDLAMCGGDCEYDCDNCMQGQIDKLIREALNGRED